MSGARFLALFLAACVLAASALIAIPMDGAEAPGQASNARAPEVEIPATRSAPARTEPGDETHASLPRLWLGNPVAR